MLCTVCEEKHTSIRSIEDNNTYTVIEWDYEDKKSN